MDYKEAKKILSKVRAATADQNQADCNLALLISVLAGKLALSNPQEYQIFIEIWLNALTEEV